MTDEKKIDALIDEAMTQVQVFASAWSMVGGPFDYGNCLENAKVEKDATRALFRGLVNAAIEQAARTPAADSSAPLGYISQMDIDDLSAYARIAVLTKAKTESQSIPVYLAAPVADSSAGASGDWDNVPTIAFEDARVQRVYNLLCHGVTPPEGEHWEGYTARIIVEALAAPVAVDSSLAGLLREVAALKRYDNKNGGTGKKSGVKSTLSIPDELLARIDAALKALPPA